jgi:hypothetical protein
MSNGCRYYGKSHAVLEATGMLVSQNGNECALVFTSYSPCAMEIAGKQPDQDLSEIAIAYEIVKKWQAQQWEEAKRNHPCRSALCHLAGFHFPPCPYAKAAKEPQP